MSPNSGHPTEVWARRWNAPNYASMVAGSHGFNPHYMPGHPGRWSYRRVPEGWLAFAGPDNYQIFPTQAQAAEHAINDHLLDFADMWDLTPEQVNVDRNYEGETNHIVGFRLSGPGANDERYGRW